MKVLLTIALYCVLAGLIATRPRADDIDIYLDGSGAVQAPLRVMIAVDLRPEFADILCVDAASDSCKAALSEELHAALDLYSIGAGNGDRASVERSADGVADTLQDDPRGSAESLAAALWSGVAVDRYDVLRAALRVVLSNVSGGLREAGQGRRVEVGLMALHADDCGGSGPLFAPDFESNPASGCSQGAYILQGFTDISEPANLSRLLFALAALPDPGRQAPWMTAPWRGHPYKIRDVYLELYRYLTGGAVFNGFLGTRDYGSRLSGNLYHTNLGDVKNDVLLDLPGGAALQPLLAPASDVLLAGSFNLETNRVAGAQYISPIGQQEACSGIAMLNLMFGAVGDSHADTNAAIAALPAADGLGLDLSAGGEGDRALVARLAAGVTSQGDGGEFATVPPVRSYFFSHRADASTNSLAAAGGTAYARSLADPRRMVPALESAFAQVAGGSTTLLSASILADDHGRGALAGDIYLTLFRPEPGPLWPGNIKKLKLVELSGSDFGAGRKYIAAQAPLVQPPTPALSAEDGQILTDALTFWTDPAGRDVQAFDGERGETPGRDGRSVSRGGAGQQITGFLADTVGASNSEPGARQLFTLNPDEPGEMLALDASRGTQSALSALLDPADLLAAEDELNLIRWIRGQDSFDADGDADRTESRDWLLADPMHSRPLAVNYGARPGTAYSDANPDIRIFFGTNDGIFHILQNTTPAGAESGRESWAFIPPEMLGMQSRLARNSISAMQSHPYGLDGEAVSLVNDRDGNGAIELDQGDSVWVFIGQRRGGSGLYAFDVSDPDNPRYMWKLDNASPGFEQMALSFSTPRVARLDLGEAEPTPVLVFAGGYNGGWQGSQRVGKDAGAGNDLIGNAIYVVNPADGRLIWRAVGPDGGAAPDSDQRRLFVPGLVDSIPSPVTLVDADHNGVDDRAYVGDSGGNVWRIELTEYEHRQADTEVTDASNWHLTRLATLGGAAEDDRRFFHAPDVVQSRDGFGEYDGVVMVSGNRADPREIQTRNYAYLLKDRRTADHGSASQDSSFTRIGHGQLADITGACISDSSRDCMEAELEPGWKLALQTPGEKGLSTPLVSNGKVLFTSYVPSAESHQGDSLEDAANTCIPRVGHGRIYAVNLRNGSPSMTRSGEIRLPEAEDATRFLSIGPGLPGAVQPLHNGVLIPGGTLQDGALASVPGRTWWRAYWREEEVDTL